MRYYAAIIVLLLAAGAVAQETESEALRAKATHIEREAHQAYMVAVAEAQQLRADADLLEQHADKLTDSAKAEIKTRADAAAADIAEIKDAELDARAEQALKERRAMKARGEDIEVPKDVAAMRAIIEAQEAKNDNGGR